jgi:hypothetical protein
VEKVLADSIATPIDLSNWLFTKLNTDLVVSSESLTPIDTTKRLDDTPVVTEVMTRSMSNFLSDNYANLSETYTYSIDKPLQDTQIISESITGKNVSLLVTDINIALPIDTATLEAGKLLEDTYASSLITEVLTRDSSKSLTDTPLATDQIANEMTKYVTDTTVGTFTESGYVTKNPYDEGGYFLEIYATPYETTF